MKLSIEIKSLFFLAVLHSVSGLSPLFATVPNLSGDSQTARVAVACEGVLEEGYMLARLRAMTLLVETPVFHSFRDPAFIDHWMTRVNEAGLQSTLAEWIPGGLWAGLYCLNDGRANWGLAADDETLQFRLSPGARFLIMDQANFASFNEIYRWFLRTRGLEPATRQNNAIARLAYGARYGEPQPLDQVLVREANEVSSERLDNIFDSRFFNQVLGNGEIIAGISPEAGSTIVNIVNPEAIIAVERRPARIDPSAPVRPLWRRLLGF